MTKEEIIEMANEYFSSVEYDSGNVHECYEFSFKELVAFAKLVAEKEREKFCAVLRQLHDSYSLTSDSNAIRARGQA